MFVPFCAAVPLITTFITGRQLLTEQKCPATEVRKISRKHTYRPTRIMRLKIMITFAEYLKEPVY